MSIYTWSYRAGCPEANMPAGEPFREVCRYCGYVSVWRRWASMMQITGEFGNGYHIYTCQSCSDKIGRGQVLQPWRDPASAEADLRMRVEAMIVRGKRHHGLTNREAEMVRKKLDTALAVKQFTASNEEPEKFYPAKDGEDPKITIRWAKWDRERRQAEAKRASRSSKQSTSGRMVRAEAHWTNVGDTPVKGSDGRTYGVEDTGSALSGRSFAPWITVTQFPDFGEASEQIAVEISNPAIGLIGEVIYSPEARLCPGWTAEQEKAFGAAVIDRGRQNAKGRTYEALWNPGLDSQFTAPHNHDTSREDYNKVATMDSTGDCARIVALKGKKSLRVMKGAA